MLIGICITYNQIALFYRTRAHVSTGNIGSKKTTEFLARVAPNLHQVRGDFDKDASLPDKKVVQIGNFKIGLIHGHQVCLLLLLLLLLQCHKSCVFNCVVGIVFILANTK